MRTTLLARGRLWIAWTAAALSLAGCSKENGGVWDRLPAELAGGIVVYGDSRTGHSVHGLLVEGMSSLAPAAVIHTGDLVDDGFSASDWDTFDRITSVFPPATPFYPALGNHEGDSPLFFTRFDLPGNERWYAVDLGAVRLVVLDTQSSLSVGSTQFLWFESHLATLDTAVAPIVVSFHYPPYTTGEHPEDEKGLKQSIVPLIEQHGVDLVLSGHQHNYERSTVNGVRYVVTGGGGAPLHGFARESPYSEIRRSTHHFCVLWSKADGSLWLDAWDWEGGLVDRFEVWGR